MFGYITARCGKFLGANHPYLGRADRQLRGICELIVDIIPGFCHFNRRVRPSWWLTSAIAGERTLEQRWRGCQSVSPIPLPPDLLNGTGGSDRRNSDLILRRLLFLAIQYNTTIYA